MEADIRGLERWTLETENQRNGKTCYFVFFDGSDLAPFHAYIVGPDTGVYRFKLVKLHVKLPANFAIHPPEIKFIHNTTYQIHPSFFKSGNICFSLIGDHDHHTWKDKEWETRETCHGVLLHIRELLDDNPFKHEPWGQDNPELSRFVQFVTWEALLFKYIDTETDLRALAWLRGYVKKYCEKMVHELWWQRGTNLGRDYFVGPLHERVPAKYVPLFEKLSAAVKRARLPPRQLTPRQEMPMDELRLRDEAAWTWAGQVSLKWSLLFSRHPDQQLWGQQYQT